MVELHNDWRVQEEGSVVFSDSPAMSGKDDWVNHYADERLTASEFNDDGPNVLDWTHWMIVDGYSSTALDGCVRSNGLEYSAPD